MASSITNDARGWYLYSTRDGGSNWSQLSHLLLPLPDDQNVMLDMRFLDYNNGWFLVQTGAGVMVFKTLDSGKTILRDQGNAESIFMSSFSARNRTVWLVGLNNLIAKRDGEQWQLQSVASFGRGGNWLRGLMLDDKTGFIVGQGRKGVILKTDDAGKSWHSAFDSDSTARFSDISFFDSHSGCTVGTSQSLYCTSDVGEHWHEMPTLPPAREDEAEDFVRVLFLSPKHVYVIRDGGFIYESVDGGKAWRDGANLFAVESGH